jgi:hypothetical protein
MKPPASRCPISDGSICVMSPTWPTSIRSLVVVLVGQQQFLGANEAAVLAGQADRLATGLIDQVDHVLVDLTTEHHLDDFHRFGVGDAHPLDEFALSCRRV